MKKFPSPFGVVSFLIMLSENCNLLESAQGFRLLSELCLFLWSMQMIWLLARRYESFRLLSELCLFLYR